MNKTIRAYIAVDSRGSLRIMKRQPRLRFNEFAFPLTIVIPDTFWGKSLKEGAQMTVPPDQKFPMVSSFPPLYFPSLQS